MSNDAQPDPRLDTFNRTLEDTGSIAAAARAVGYSPKSADRGKSALAQPLRDAATFWQRAQQTIAKGQEVTKERADALIKGTLAEITVDGQKDADRIAAAKTLGTHKDIAVFTPESFIGAIVISPPDSFVESIMQKMQQSLATTPVIDAEPVTPSDTEQSV